MENTTERFLKIDYRILGLQYIKDTNGDDKLFSLANRVLYAHLKVRFDFFKSRGEKYYDTNKAISTAVGVDEKTVSRGLKFLQDIGLVKVKKEKWRNLPKNVYEDVVDIFSEVKPSLTIISPPVQPEPVVKYQTRDFEDYDMDGLPF